MYNECIQLTKQFAFCPNAFRVDLYKGCDFGCRYCFANMDWAQEKQRGNWAEADVHKLEKLFYKALETDKESKDILVELIRHRVPIHCGGMSDPFQNREWELHKTKDFIKLSNKYNYPVQFSTKTDFLQDEYFYILNPEIHAFQVSILGWDDEFVRRWECNTPTAKARVNFVKELRDLGFWCGVRIQPLLDITQAENLCYNLIDIPSYVTIEHFKLVLDTQSSRNAFLSLCDHKSDYIISNHKLEVRRDIKVRNIQRVKKILGNIPVGVGDNDLHYLSDSRCCCGIDLAGPAFENYLKYNLTYMATGDLEADTFIPSCNPRKHINDQKYGLKIDCKQYVEDYIDLHKDYLGPRRSSIEKRLFGVSAKKLF